MRKFKFIERIPQDEYEFQVGDEILVRKGIDPNFRWESYKVASNGEIYASSVIEEEWEKLKAAYTNSEIDDLILDNVLQSTSGLMIVEDFELPTPATVATFALVGAGTYTYDSQADIVVPAEHIGVLLWNGSVWKLGTAIKAPDDIEERVTAMKNVAGGIAGLNSENKVPSEHIDAYTKTQADTKFVQKETGKGLSEENYSNSEKQKVALLRVGEDRNKYLSETGEYLEVIVPDVPIKKIVFNGEELPPNPSGEVTMNVVTEVDMTVDELSDKPVASKAVAAELKNRLSEVVSRVELNETGEGEDRRIFTSSINEYDEVIYTSNEILIGVGGGGGGGGGVSSKIVLTKLTQNPLVKEGDDVLLDYYFDHRSTTDDESTGLSAEVEITIVSGATTRTITQRVQANSNNRIDVSKYLLVGSNSVRVKASVDTGEGISTSRISWTVNVVTINLSSNYNIANVYNVGTNITLPYTLTGGGNKVLKLYVNGVQYDEKQISSSLASGNFIIPTTGRPHGKVSLQLVAELETNSGVLKSNSIYFDVPINAGNNSPLVATRFNYADGRIITSGDPVLSLGQFQTGNVNYAAWHPTEASPTIEVEINSVTISNIKSTFREINTPYRSNEQGDFASKIKVGSVVYNFTTEVVSSGIDVEEPTDNLVLKLTGLGRSNNDVNRDVWEYNDISANLEEINFGADGWNGRSLRLLWNQYVPIYYKPFETVENGSGALAIAVKYKVTNTADDDRFIYSTLGSLGGGFKINTDSVEFGTLGGQIISAKTAQNKEIHVTFVAFPIAGNNSSEYEKLNSGMFYIYVNGIIHAAGKRSNADGFFGSDNVTDDIILESNSQLDVYSIHCYSNYLTHDQVNDLYALGIESSEEFVELYTRNDVLDSEGDITVESLPDGSRFLVVTGEQNGVTSLEYASLINDKDARYAVTEMLYVHKGMSSPYNFRAIGGCIRLQGTSSLAYPIKNFRFYFRSALSGSVFAEVWQGVNDEGTGGTLNVDTVPLHSFKGLNDRGKLPAPVNVWCGKADFAESSSSYNTGGAKLFNDVFVKTGSPLPPQKYATSSHPYDVRSSIDGEPLFLFARKTLADKPIFMGKYNFNNDKSTEQVFGFKDVPGYHLNAEGTGPSSWITQKFEGKNPTECWEVLNNDFPMGMFLNDDFDATSVITDTSTNLPITVPSWTRVFEARFPDNQSAYISGALPKPFYLERFVKWVHSTKEDPAKFKAELHLYADVDNFCKYFQFTQILAMVDQMVKNTMLCFFYDPAKDAVLAYYEYYDGDTKIGGRNDGRLKYNWDVNRQTIDEETDTYAFMGHDSVLWNNLESQFSIELKNAYVSLRSEMTDDVILRYYTTNQSKRFPERVFNLDTLKKYVTPATKGVTTLVNGVPSTTLVSTFLDSAQGSKELQRENWILNRMSLFDARYDSGLYRQTDITWKGSAPAGASVEVSSARDHFYQLSRESTIIERAEVEKYDYHTFTYNEASNIGTIFHLYGGKFMTRLDLSLWGGFTDLTFPELPLLEYLRLGDSENTYTLSVLNIGNKFPSLKDIDVTNYVNIPSLDLSECVQLQSYVGEGCTSLTTVTFAKGAPLYMARFSTALVTLSLKSLPNISTYGIMFDGDQEGPNVKTLIVEDCPYVQFEDILQLLPNVENIRFNNLKLTNTLSWLEQFESMKGIDANGNTTTYPALIGDFQSLNYIEPARLAELRAKFPELNIMQPEYSVYKYYFNVASTNNLFNTDNGTGHLIGELVQNKPFVLSGHAKNLFGAFSADGKSQTFGKNHRYLAKRTALEEMTIIQLDDSDSTKFLDGSVAVSDGTQGDIFTKMPKYWYKGVVDLENQCNLICISSNPTKPKTAEGVVAVLATNTITSKHVDAVEGTSELTALVNNSSFNAYKVEIPTNGWFNKIRIPITPKATSQTYHGALFLNAANEVVGSPVQVEGDFISPGGYVITSIPTGAKYVLYSLPNFLNGSKIVVGNSETRIEDFEDEWVESPEYLIGSMLMSQDANGKARSIGASSGAISNIRYNAQATYISKASERNMEYMSFEQYKNISWLLFLKSGTPVKTEIFGAGRSFNPNTYAVGYSLRSGIKDTYKSNYYTLDSFGTPVATAATGGHINALGIEDLWGAGPRVIHYGGNGDYRGRYSLGGRIVGSTKSSVYNVTGWAWDTPGSGTTWKNSVFGLRMDMFPAGVSQGTSTTYSASGRANLVGQNSGTAISGFNLIPFLSTSIFSYGTYGNQYNSVWLNYETNTFADRLIWNRGITEITNVNTFKNLSNDV